MATRPAFDLPLRLRAGLAVAGGGITALVAYALLRAMLGLAPSPAWAQASLREAAILIHIAAVVPAIPLGIYIFLSPKGGARHKRLGRIWLSLMVATALSSFFIRHLNDGDFSAIHLLSAATLFGAWRAIAAARRGDIAAHRHMLVAMFIGALLVAGLFTFVPGRLFWLWTFA